MVWGPTMGMADAALGAWSLVLYNPVALLQFLLGPSRRGQTLPALVCEQASLILVVKWYLKLRNKNC